MLARIIDIGGQRDQALEVLDHVDAAFARLGDTGPAGGGGGAAYITEEGPK
jgi:hypothetical protein